MQRNKRTGNVAVKPAYPAGGTAGFFAKPDPLADVPATPVGWEWYQRVTEELVAVIEGAGLVLSDTDDTQLRQAILKMVQSANRAVSIDGATFAPAVTGTGKAVYYDTANSRFDLAIADGSAAQNVVGIADVPNAKVYMFGSAVLFAGLTPGSRYFLSGVTAGALSTVATSNGVFMGVAKSATEVFIDIDGLSARLDQANNWTAGQRGGFAVFPALAGTVTLDLAQRNNWEANGLTGNLILGNPSAMPIGQSGVLRVVQGATPYTIAYGSYFKATNGVFPSLTPLAGAVDLLPYFVETATRIWIGVQGDGK